MLYPVCQALGRFHHGSAKYRMQYPSFIFLLTDHRQNTAQTSEYADRPMTKLGKTRREMLP